MSRDGTGAGGGTTRDALLDAISDLSEPQVEEALAFVLFLKDDQADERLLRRPEGDVSGARWWEACRIMCSVAEPAKRDGFLRWAHEQARREGWPMLAFACSCAAEAQRVPEALRTALAVDVAGQLAGPAVAAEARSELVAAFHALVASDEDNVLQPLLARMLHGGDDAFELAAGAILGAMGASRARWTSPHDDLAGTSLGALASALRDVTYPRAADLVRRVHDKQLPSGIPVMVAALEGGASGAAVKHLASLSRRLAVDVSDFWAELLSADASVVPTGGSGGHYLRLGEQVPVGELLEIEEHFDYFIMNARAWVTGEMLYYDRDTGAGVKPDAPFISSVAEYVTVADRASRPWEPRWGPLCRDLVTQIGNAFLEDRPFVIERSILAPCLEGALRDRKLAPADRSKRLFDARRWMPVARPAARREGLSCRGRRFFPGTATENARTHVLKTIEEQFWPPLLALSTRTYPGNAGDRLRLALYRGLVGLVHIALQAIISVESYLERYLAEVAEAVGPRVSALVRDPSVRKAVTAGALRPEDELRPDAWMADPRLRPAAEAFATFKDLYRDEVRQIQSHRRAIMRFVESADGVEPLADPVFLEHLFDETPIHLAPDDRLWSTIMPVIVCVRDP
jgi:hypothetical protein